MNTVTVLAVGTDEPLAHIVESVIATKKDHRLESASTVDKALERVRRGGVSLVLMHLRDSRRGVEIARFFYEISLDRVKIPVVIVNDANDLEQNLSFLRMGAVECLNRPLNISRLSFLVDMITARDRIAGPPKTKPEALAISRDEEATHHFLATPTLQPILNEIQLVAGLDTTVLLTGETGTGKTRMANLIHQLSPRRAKPFLTVNCGTLSETLIASELFGHVRGAFTGADRDQAGKFAQANDGTLLLDNVESLPPEAQSKFLRAVDERLYEPIGSSRTQKVTVRFIVATNKSLEQEAAAGRFRFDLFYRLNVIAFHLPPLRERREEIRPLAAQFAEEFGCRHQRGAGEILEDAFAALEDHSWPGNVRELRNVIERAVILSNGAPISRAVLPEAFQPAAAAAPPTGGLNRLDQARLTAERAQLVAILRQFGNNRTKVAETLGISRTALYKKLHKHHLA